MLAGRALTPDDLAREHALNPGLMGGGFHAGYSSQPVTQTSEFGEIVNQIQRKRNGVASAIQAEKASPLRENLNAALKDMSPRGQQEFQERVAKERLQQEQLAKELVEDDEKEARKAQKEKDKKRKKKAGQKEKEKAKKQEADRKKQEKAEQELQAKQEQERQAGAEREMRARVQRERRAKVEEERQAKAEQEWKAKAERGTQWHSKKSTKNRGSSSGSMKTDGLSIRKGSSRTLSNLEKTSSRDAPNLEGMHHTDDKAGKAMSLEQPESKVIGSDLHQHGEAQIPRYLAKTSQWGGRGKVREGQASHPQTPSSFGTMEGFWDSGHSDRHDPNHKPTGPPGAKTNGEYGKDPRPGIVSNDPGLHSILQQMHAKDQESGNGESHRMEKGVQAGKAEDSVVRGPQLSAGISKYFEDPQKPRLNPSAPEYVPRKQAASTKPRTEASGAQPQGSA